MQFFITNDRPNVAGLVLAGSADFKTELSQSDMFDMRLQAVVLAVVDVSYGAGGGAATAARFCSCSLALHFLHPSIRCVASLLPFCGA